MHHSDEFRRENAKVCLIARSESAEAIQTVAVAAHWIASLALAMTTVEADTRFTRRTQRTRRRGADGFPVITRRLPQ